MRTAKAAYVLYRHWIITSVLPTHLDQPILLILLLRSSRPVRGFIFAILLLFIPFLFCLVDRLGVVLGWRVDGVENLWKRLAALLKARMIG